MSTRLTERVSRSLGRRVGRRGFLVRVALAGSATVVTRGGYLFRPMDAYAAICNCKGTDCDCGARCCEGWTEFCCTLSGENTCPAGTFAAGWWKADGTQYCNGPRYYIDCNATCRCPCGASGFCPECDGRVCGCPGGNCDHWASGCNVFRYGQCHQEQACAGRIVCRVVSCTPPWEIDGTCTTVAATSNVTGSHHRACANGDTVAGQATRASVAAAPTPSGHGYWVMDAVGGVATFGDAGYFGSLPELRRRGIRVGTARALSLTPTPTGRGYWVLDEKGGVFAFGDARFRGSVPSLRQRNPGIGSVAAVALRPTPSGGGYWVLDEKGGVFAFGDARYHGSVPELRRKNPRIGTALAVALQPSSSGGGYWVLDEKGGVFAFGDARYAGSIPELRHRTPQIGNVRAVDLAAGAAGRGYWVLDEKGGVFAFGGAPYRGSIPELRRTNPRIGAVGAVALLPTPTGMGYWILDATGGIFAFGDARFYGRP